LKYWEIIADNLGKAGWSWGCVSTINSVGQTIWIVDAHRDDGKRFVVHADEKLTAFVELKSAFHVPHALLSDPAQAQKRTTKVSSTYNANSAILKTDLNQVEDFSR